MYIYIYILFILSLYQIILIYELAVFISLTLVAQRGRVRSDVPPPKPMENNRIRDKPLASTEITKKNAPRDPH